MTFPLLRNSTIKVMLALLLACSMWFYVQRILIPHQIVDAAAHDHPRGNLSDLYPRWLGARELLLHGRDPYRPDITSEIQRGYYGRAIDPLRNGDPQDQQAFAYPIYIIFLLAPVVNLPFSEVSKGFFWFLCIISACNIPLWLRALRWKAPISVVSILLLLSLSSFQFIEGVKLEQFTLLIAALLAACALLLVNEKFGVAGVVLGFATIKPQLVMPLVAWLTLWSVSDWRQRKAFVCGFSATVGTLFAAGEWALPGWPKEFLRAIVAYRQYTHAASLLDGLTNDKWGPVLAGVFVLTTGAVCWRLRHESAQSPQFVWIFALVLAVTLLTIPTVSGYNQVLLLPGVLILARYARHVWRRNTLERFVWILAAGVILWPWFAALGLSTASFILPPARVQQAWALPFYTSIAIPFAVFGLLIQYAFQVLPSNRSSPVPAELP